MAGECRTCGTLTKHSFAGVSTPLKLAEPTSQKSLISRSCRGEAPPDGENRETSYQYKLSTITELSGRGERRGAERSSSALASANRI